MSLGRLVGRLRNVSSRRTACAATVTLVFAVTIPLAADPAPTPPTPTTRPIASPAEAAPEVDVITPDTPSAESQTDYWIEYTVRRGLLLFIVASVLTGIYLARRGKVLPSRDIPGLLAFDEAVSRATEMGRPSLFTSGGAAELKWIQTYASMPMLRRVAELSGELGNRLIVPVCYPDALPLHSNAMRDGYAYVGAVDQFHHDDVRFFPGGQFFFAIASMGWMLEELPAACFYFGRWEADSLLFAETGQVVNAMQIAGTDQLYQIPFFIASCDYTLIGEEFWAASGKLSGDPKLLGSLGAQDLFKIGVLVVIVGGTLLCFSPAFAGWIDRVRSTLE